MHRMAVEGWPAQQISPHARHRLVPPQPVWLKLFPVQVMRMWGECIYISYMPVCIVERLVHGIISESNETEY